MSSQLQQQVAQAIKLGLAEAAEAFGRAFDCKVSLSAEEPKRFDPVAFAKQYATNGLMVAIGSGSKAACIVISADTKLLPEWYTADDPTSRSKLDTLAQELGLILLPESFPAEKFTSKPAENVGKGVLEADPADDSFQVDLRVRHEDGTTETIVLVMPLDRPEVFFGLSEPADSQSQAEKSQEDSRSEQSTQAEPPPQDTQQKQHAGAPTSQPGQASPATKQGGFAPTRTISEHLLPPYTRSLLKIKLPVVVVLARKKQPLSSILKLVPGSIIQFDKSCEEPLDLEVGGRLIAKGQAVKVGEKFGLRITTMVLPEEKFVPIRPKQPLPTRKAS